MKTRLVLILFLFAKIASGQGDALEHRVYLKICPLALIDPWNGSTLKVGAEINNEGGNATYFELGTFFSGAKKPTQNKGILADIEFKHYISDEYTNCGPYVSLELLYKNQSYHTSDSIDLNPIYKKEYSLHKNVGCATVKFGYLHPVNNIFNVEFFIGLGIRIKNAFSSLTADENAHIKSSADYGPNLFANQAGHFVYPNIDIGMKFVFGL